MKIKITALFLALILCLAAFAGCSKEAAVPEKGEVSSGIYKSKALGISFAIPDGGWEAMDETELEEYYESMSELSVKVISDLFCYSESGSSVIINFEELGETGEGIDENGYLVLAEEKILESCEANGYTAEIGDVFSEKIGDSDFSCLKLEINGGGALIFEQLMVKKIGGYMGIITAAAYSEAELSAILSGFAGI